MNIPPDIRAGLLDFGERYWARGVVQDILAHLEQMEAKAQDDPRETNLPSWEEIDKRIDKLIEKAIKEIKDGA